MTLVHFIIHLVVCVRCRHSLPKQISFTIISCVYRSSRDQIHAFTLLLSFLLIFIVHFLRRTGRTLTPDRDCLNGIFVVATLLLLWPPILWNLRMINGVADLFESRCPV